jgi:hypothetical protein
VLDIIPVDPLEAVTQELVRAQVSRASMALEHLGTSSATT